MKPDGSMTGVATTAGKNATTCMGLRRLRRRQTVLLRVHRPGRRRWPPSCAGQRQRALVVNAGGVDRRMGNAGIVLGLEVARLARTSGVDARLWVVGRVTEPLFPGGSTGRRRGMGSS